jgi:DNA polymerase V
VVNNQLSAELLCGPAGLKGFLIPMVSASVAAGLPEESVNTDFEGSALFDSLVVHPQNTYALRAKGQSMTGAGIDSGDILIVDRAIRHQPNSIIIADVDGEFTVKRFVRENGQLYLVPANPDFERIKIQSYQQCVSWGVVTHVIKSLYPPPQRTPD